MTTPDLFPALGFSIAPGKRAFTPKPCPAGKKRVLARCRVKGCKFCKALDLSTEQCPYAFAFGQGPGTFTAISRNELSTARATVHCAQHPNSLLTFDEIAGTHNESRQCDPRCTGAIGPNCSCQCGGANHGANWL